MWISAKDKKDKKNQCANVMKKGGLSNDFAKHVSHAIHSLTVEDIKMYFNKNVDQNNNIPVGKDINRFELLFLSYTFISS